MQKDNDLLKGENVDAPESLNYADSALWRMVVYISKDSFSAWLKNVSAPQTPPRLLVNTHFEVTEGKILQKIESTVYDNPAVLDDYEADVIVETSKSILAPSSLMENEKGEWNAPEYFNAVYNAKEEDIMEDALPEGVTNIYCLEPGLKSFLERTFPGTRVQHHLSALYKFLIKDENNRNHIVAVIRKGEVDILSFRGKELMSMAVQNWQMPLDIAYHILNAAKGAEFEQGKFDIELTGEKDVTDEITPILERFAGSVTLGIWPASPDFENLPVSAALCSSRIPRGK